MKCGGDRCPEVFFQHMIEHELKNLSIVQSEVEQLRQTRKFKIIHYFGLGGRNAYVAMIPTEQFVLDLQQSLRNSSTLCAQFSSWIRDRSNISVSINELYTEAGITTEDVSALCDLGYLRQRSDLAEGEPAYWLTHPVVTSVGHHLAATERFILAAIRRTRFKEMNGKDFYSLFAHHTNAVSQSSSGKDNNEAAGAEEPPLKKRKASQISIDELYRQKGKGSGEASKKLAASPLPAHFHLLDLLGRKVLTATPTADNRSLLLRIAK